MTRSLLSLLSGITIALSSIVFLLWKTQFGVDLTDESFYLLPAWKLFELGDRPFVNEIYNASRLSDFLNFIFIQPWLPFSVWATRISAVVFYAFCLIVYCSTCFERGFRLICGLTFATCLLYDVFVMPTWSYNWWARNALLVHHALVIRGLRHPLSSRRFLCAGFALGIAVIAYNTLAVVAITSIILFMVGGVLFLARVHPIRKMALPYCVGLILCLIPVTLYLCSASVRPHWLASLQAMNKLGEYTWEAGVDKFFSVLVYLKDRREARLLLFLWVLVVVAQNLNFKGRMGSFVSKYPRALAIAIVIFPLIYVAGRFGQTGDKSKIFSLYASFGLVSCLALVVWGTLRRDFAFLVIGVVSILVAITMACSSVNGRWALVWSIPLLLIPFMAEYCNDKTSSTRGSFHECLYLGARQLTTLLVICVLVGAIRIQWSENYRDVGVKLCTSRVNVVPLQGLRTSERRAFLIGKISEIVDKRNFILAFDSLPGALLFSSVRSAANTIFIGVSAPVSLSQFSLNEMVRMKRIPEVIVKSKYHPWTWGSSNNPVRYRNQEPFSDFTDCVKQKTLVSYPEFVAYLVNTSRIEKCAGLVVSNRGIGAGSYPPKR